MFDRSAKDTRTTEQKLEAMARDPGASEGERTNAQHLLFKRRAKVAKKEHERKPWTAPKPREPRTEPHEGFIWCPICKASAGDYTPNSLPTHMKLRHSSSMRRGRNANGASATWHGPPPPGFKDEGSAKD